MRRSPDGMYSFSDQMDLFEMIFSRTAPLAAGAFESILIMPTLGNIFKVESIYCHAPIIATATGNHYFTVFDKIIGGIDIVAARIGVTGTAALVFNNCSVSMAGRTIERVPISDEATISQVKGIHVSVGISSAQSIKLQYFNNTNLAQTGARNYAILFKRILTVSLVEAVG